MADPDQSKLESSSVAAIHKKSGPNADVTDDAVNPALSNLTPKEAGHPKASSKRQSSGSTTEAAPESSTEASGLGKMAAASTAAAAAQASTPDGPDSVGPSPYGTRSRNRSGNARPNYAEDRDTDADFELSSSRRAHGSASAAQSTRAAAEAERAAAQATRKAGLPLVPPREHIPGISSFTVAEGGSASRSKKRKSPGASTTVTTSNSSPAAAPAAMSTRKSSQLIPASSAASTNLVTFENTNACLVNGCLVADDKSKFAPNGACPRVPSVRNEGPVMLPSPAVCSQITRLYLSRVRTAR